MTDIKSAFQNGKAFIPFVTAGDPDLETTEKLLIEMSKNGADIIEIGIPFSDPIAEGVVIQEADLRSLSAGHTEKNSTFPLSEFRAASEKPLQKKCSMPFFHKSLRPTKHKATSITSSVFR